MQASLPSRRNTLAARFLGGLGVVLLLSGVIVAPLYAAMMLCGMPCCHHAASASPTVSSVRSCQTDCSVTGDVVKEAAAMPVAASPETSLLPISTIADTFAGSALRPLRSAEDPAPPPVRALHLVNSVFLI
jgi:hypothetical protein